MQRLKKTHLSSERLGRQARRALLPILLFFGTSGCNRTPPASNGVVTTTGPDTRRVTFVQWSNPHLFDAGSSRHAEGVFEEALDNRAALHWAVLQTNRMVLAEHRTIDFVVITGGFGLENTLPDLTGALPKNCDCPKRKPGNEGPIEPISIEQAAAEVARDLRALVVKRVYLVPGDEDLCQADPADMHRWVEFVYRLKGEIAKQDEAREASLRQSAKDKTANRANQPLVQVDAPSGPEVEDLTYAASRLYYDTKDPRVLSLFGNAPPEKVPHEPPSIHGIRLLGLNSASFKSSKATAAATEISSLRSQIEPGFSYLIFTHIPALEDPNPVADKPKAVQQPKQKGQAEAIAAHSDGAIPTTSWKLDSNSQKVWHDDILSKTEVLGVFAGHFHTDKRESYPQNFGKGRNAVGTASAKQWVAPPLAAEDQWSLPPQKTARGMLLVTVTGNGAVRVSGEDGEDVASVPIWFSSSDQKAATAGDDKLAEARAAELDRKWDEAAKKYEEALAVSSIDSRTRESALAGYAHARREMRQWWWNSTLANWLYLNAVPLLATLSIAFCFLVLYGLLRWVRAFGFATLVVKKLVVPRFRGRATISATAKMTGDAPSEEFSAQILAAGEEIRTRLLQEQENWAARHITLLAPSSSSFDSLINSIPKVRDGDVSSWVKFLAILLQMSPWRVDSRLAVSQPDRCITIPVVPTPGTTNNGLPQGGELSGYAVLQWGWFVKNSWRRKKSITDDRSALRDLARCLAELVLGEAFV